MSEEIRVDLRETTPESMAFYRKQTEAMHRFNHALPASDEYTEAMNDLFQDRIGEDSYVAAPINGAALEHLHIGKTWIEGEIIDREGRNITELVREAEKYLIEHTFL